MLRKLGAERPCGTALPQLRGHVGPEIWPGASFLRLLVTRMGLNLVRVLASLQLACKSTTAMAVPNFRAGGPGQCSFAFLFSYVNAELHRSSGLRSGRDGPQPDTKQFSSWTRAAICSLSSAHTRTRI